MPDRVQSCYRPQLSILNAVTTDRGAVDAGMSHPADRPSGGATPVSVPLNLTLVQRPDLVIRVTVASAYPNGFAFLLSVGFDIRRIPFNRVDFYAPRELGYPLPARLQMRFSDGRVGDSLVKLPGHRFNEAAILVYTGGMSHPPDAQDQERDSFRQHETRWWVSPLPPPGPLEFAAYLMDSPELAGTGGFAAELILEAARRSEVQWGTQCPGR